MKIAIIDDKEDDLQLIKTYILKYFTENYSKFPLNISLFLSGEAFLPEFYESSFDIIFIDHYMKNLSGLETARIIRQSDSSALLIFITASRDYAVDSYRVRACGYLVKPVSYDAFYETMSMNAQSCLKKLQFVEFKSSSGSVRVFLKDIIYCDISGHYAQIHTFDKTIRIRITFSKMADALKPYPDFLLCYRGCLVNMRQIMCIENMAFLMAGGERIPFRKKEQNDIMKTYSCYLFEKVRNKDI